MSPRFLLPLAGLSLRLCAAGPLEIPAGVGPGISVQLVAQEPEIRTPTALATDARGRVWVLENNTHFRPKNYPGPANDRIVILDGFGADGRATKFTTFAEDFRDGMGLQILPDGDVILSTRTATWCLQDKDQDGVYDQRTRLLELTTTDAYPHNGLSSVTADAQGHLYVGLGENHGVPWTLTGADGTQIKGSDEGGIFRCDRQGNHLERWALGLWNPFGLTVDSAGRLFCLDNAPGAGSNCRLLQIVRHGDYGYRYRYGRTIQHPFLSWAGQLPGTLPSICLSGEAPVGLLARGSELLGASWNDHGIQRFPLRAQGASFVATPEWLVRGGHRFRPMGLAAAPDGTLYVGEWVAGAYEVSGQGRVWRVIAPPPSGSVPPILPAEKQVAALLAGTVAGEEAIQLLKSADPFLVHGTIDLLARDNHLGLLQEHLADSEAKIRLGVLLAMRRRGGPEGVAGLTRWLQDASGPIKQAALKWIAEERLGELRPKLEDALQEPLSRATFEAYLAALQQIKNGQPDPAAGVEELLRIALDPSRGSALRALALRLIRPDHPALTVALLGALAEPTADDSPKSASALAVVAAQILATRSGDDAQGRLRALAANPRLVESVRLEALSGLALSAGKPETDQILRQALASGQSGLIREALRSLRGHLELADIEALHLGENAAATQGELAQQLAFAARNSPSDAAKRVLRLQTPDPTAHPAEAQTGTPTDGDPTAGRRLFFHPKGPGCATCHAVEGRGGTIGPDLTDLGGLSAEQLVEAIREPSAAIAPAYTHWHLTLRDGSEGFGIDQFKDDKTFTTLRDATGASVKYRTEEIVTREALPVSLMPPGLTEQMTAQELRDLVAFLRGQ